MTKPLFASQNFTAGELNAIVKKIGGEDAARRLLRNELIVVEAKSLDNVVRRRMQKGGELGYWEYSDWRLVYPGITFTGRTTYDLKKDIVQLALHSLAPGPEASFADVQKYFEQNPAALEGTLGIADGREIQKKGVSKFRELFPATRVFLWKSISFHPAESGLKYVPYMEIRDDEVVIDLESVQESNKLCREFNECVLCFA